MPPSKHFATSQQKRSYGKHQNGTNYRKQERKKESERLQPPHWVIERQHNGEYLYTVEGFVMSRQGDVWRTPLECRMEGPIRVPQIGVSHWRALLHAESLVEGPDCGAQPGELEGCKSKRKAKTSRKKKPSLPKCHQEQNHPDFCWCYFQQCARLNMCFR